MTGARRSIDETATKVQDPSQKTRAKSNIDLISECDNFPYYQTSPAAYTRHVERYYALRVTQYPNVVLGYLLPDFAGVLHDYEGWQTDEGRRSLILVSGDNEIERSAIVAKTTEALRRSGRYAILEGWRDELYPVYGPNKELLFSVERAASALFGVVTYGCHMTAFVRLHTGGLSIWVPRRAYTKQTYGGMLDNTVAGGLSTGETALGCIIRESAEEASLPAELVQNHIRAAGMVTYFHVRDQRAGGETGLLQPECQFVYDLELTEDIIPRPSDNEVQDFTLMNISDVKNALQQGQFKPNCALVLLDFFVRHGILTGSDEDYITIVARLHRLLEFPTV